MRQTHRYAVARADAVHGITRAGTNQVLVERFSHLLGEPPLTYLARWRMQFAARILETTERKVLRVAMDARYESEAAFNRAFKRQFEVPPAQYRHPRRLGREQVAAGAQAPASP